MLYKEYTQQTNTLCLDEIFVGAEMLFFDNGKSCSAKERPLYHFIYGRDT